MVTYSWLTDSGAFDVELIERYSGDESLGCEVDDCIQLGLVLISTKFGKSYSVISCYPHMRYAMEDVMWHIRNNLQYGLDKTIGALKRVIEHERKLGFEYD